MILGAVLETPHVLTPNGPVLRWEISLTAIWMTYPRIEYF